MKNKLNTFFIDLNVKEEKKNEFSILIDDFFKFADKVNLNFKLDLYKKEYSFIEKFIYDIAQYHMERLSIDNVNKHLTFWLKSTEYDFEYLHMHTDHDDYELATMGTDTIKPLFTSLTYFNDNDNPTLITDVNINMFTEKEFDHKENKKIAFSFPKTLKNIVFDSGNYYHGESYINNKCSSRKVIVIALSDSNNIPLQIPFFDNDFFMYWRFMNLHRNINCDLFDSTNKIVVFNSDDHNVVTIVLENNDLINNNFFKDILIKKDKYALYKFRNLFKKFDFEKKNTFILDFSKIILEKKCHAFMKNEMQYWDINFNIDQIDEKCIEICNIFTFYKKNKSFLLDLTKSKYSFIEKYVFEIANFYTDKFNFDINDFFVSFDINSINNNTFIYGKETKSFFTCLVYTKTDVEFDPTIFTNIDKESFKYKDFEKNNSTINLFIPCKNKIISFDPSFYHTRSAKTICVNIWKQKPELPLYECESEHFFENDHKILSIKKSHDSEKIINVDDTVLNFDCFLEQLLYSKNVNYELLKQLTITTYNNVNNYIFKREEKKDKVSQQLKQMHFNIV